MRRCAAGGQASVEYAVGAAIFAGIAFLGGKLLSALLEAFRSGAVNAAIVPGRDF